MRHPKHHIAYCSLFFIVTVSIACQSSNKGPTKPCPQGGLTTEEQQANWRDYQCEEPQICFDNSNDFTDYVVDPNAAKGRLQIAITNCSTGNTTLEIASVSIFGDERCYFGEPELSTLTLKPGESENAFLAVTYKPAQPGEDFSQVELVSNAQNFPKFRVGFCGRARMPDSAETDAGSPFNPDSGSGEFLCQPRDQARSCK